MPNSVGHAAVKLPCNRWLFAAALWFSAGVYALVFRESALHTPPPFPHFDKLGHAALFFAQCWLLTKAWLAEGREPPYAVLAACALVYAAASEAAQHFFTNTRQGDWLDAAADMAGCAAALYFARVLHRLRRKKTGSLK